MLNPARPARRYLHALTMLALLAGCTSEGPRAAPSKVEPEPPRPAARVESPPAVATSLSAAPLPSSSANNAASTPTSPPPAALDRSRYAWLDDPSVKPPEPTETLEARFAPPPGYRRVELPKGSFGAWLRGLPLAKPGTPVVSYQGGVILPDGHPNLAAVVAVDIGAADLQQCADSVIRMHAEWRWASGARDMSYRAASGVQMPFAKWARGERPAASANGQSLQWEAHAKPDEGGGTHPSFRKYLDAVFMWANTVALSIQAKKITTADMRPGDFVIMPGNPGHAVLILDMAVSERGERMALLGQGFMPAQSFQVLRPSPASAWFPLDPSGPGLTTPFWPTFPWDALRRLNDS